MYHVNVHYFSDAMSLLFSYQQVIIAHTGMSISISHIITRTLSQC